MVVRCLLVSFLLTVNHFNQVSVQAKNVTDILDEQNENVLQAFTSDSKSMNGLKNESYHEQECDCGFGSEGCQLNVHGEKICDCMADYAQINDKCEKCDCGFWSTGCHYNEYGGKVCNCLNDYAQKNDKCERCDCGQHATSCFFIDNKKVCTCSKNYLRNDYYGKCIECDCGYDAISCHLDGLSKVCTCREGYIVEDGKCTNMLCDCGSGSVMCILMNGKKVCVCEAEKVQIGETCHTPAPYGWKIATIVIAVMFGITLVGMGVFIFKSKQ